MAEDKRIGIGIDTSSYDEGFSRIQRRSDELATDMIRNSRELELSSKDIIKNLEEQIKIIERRNKLSTQYKQGALESAQLRGDISQEKFQSAQRQIKIETAEEKIHTSLLREIADNIKIGDKEQLRESRSSAEKLYESIKSQEEIDAALSKEEAGGETGGRSRNAGGVYGVGYTNKIVGAGNIYEAGAGTLAEATRRAMGLAGIGLVGTLAALGVGKAIQAALPYEKELGKNVAVSGGNTGSYEGFLRTQGEGMGFSMNETLARRFDITRARMTSRGAAGATLDALSLERGLGLDQGLTSGLESMTRSGGAGAMTGTQGMISALRSVGIIQGQDMAALPEYLQTLVNLSKEQIKYLGKVDEGVNTKMIAGIANLDDSFKNPEVLNQVVGQVRQGLTQSQTPQIEALQYSVLSRIKPGASLFELQKMKEDPFSKDNQQYLPEFLRSLQNISGGNQEMFFMNIMQTFGLSARLSERMGKGFQEGNLQDILDKDFTGKTENIRGRGERATGDLFRSSAQFINVFSQTGETLVKGMNELLEGMITFTDQITESQKNIQEGADALRENAAELVGIKKVMVNIVAQMAENAKYRSYGH